MAEGGTHSLMEGQEGLVSRVYFSGNERELHRKEEEGPPLDVSSRIKT